MEAIILAGGMGTRLKSIVSDVPKPMAPIGGRPFLEHQMDYWIGQGVRRFIISIGHMREVIRDHFGSRYRESDVTYAIEEQPMGTGGGLFIAMNQLIQPGPFLVMNGDTFFEIELNALRRFHDDTDAQITLSLRETENDCRYGQVQMDTASKIVTFKTRPLKPLRSLINGGVYLTEKSVFEGSEWSIGQPSSLEEHLLPELLKAGKRVFGFRSTGRFIDIGVPEDYRRASEIIFTHYKEAHK